MIAPWFITAYLVWAFGGEFTDIFVSLYNIVTSGSGGFPVGPGIAWILIYIFCGLAVILTILGIVSYLFASASMRTRASAIISLMLFGTLIAGGGLFLPGASWSDLAIAALPAAMMATLFFVRFTGRIPMLIYILLLISAVALNFFPFVSGLLGL